MVKLSRTKTKKKPKYEPVLSLPPLSHDDYIALHDSIAVHGVIVPILVDSDGLRRKIIDGNHRKQIADELNYECPEVIQSGLEDDEKRTLARALNLARRHMDIDDKRQLVRDQIKETPERSSRWIAKMLGVSPPTVISVRSEMNSTVKGFTVEKTLGQDGKYRPATRQIKSVPKSVAEQKTRTGAVSLIHGDCCKELKKIATQSVDAIITDPIYPGIDREYGKISEDEWHDLMHKAVQECRRILKPKGSAVFILQPNFEKIGKMSSWLWEFLAWASKEWNVVQDVYWWSINALPTHCTNRKVGLLRQSVKMCVWLGEPNCYRNQDAVLWEPSDVIKSQAWSNRCMRDSPSGHHVRRGRIGQVATERNGATPFNLLPIASASEHHGHPAATPFELAAWWCRYILPIGGVLLDPFCGSGTMLAAGLDQGASHVIGVEKEKKYLATAKRRITTG